MLTIKMNNYPIDAYIILTLNLALLRAFFVCLSIYTKLTFNFFKH